MEWKTYRRITHRSAICGLREDKEIQAVADAYVHVQYTPPAVDDSWISRFDECDLDEEIQIAR